MIDFHTHIYPDKIAGTTVKKLSSDGRFFPALDGRGDSLIESMKKEGIQLSLVLPVATNPLPEKVRHLNEFALRMDGSQGLLSLGGIHPDCPDWKAELHFIKESGLKGIKIHPAYQQVALDDIRYLRIMEEAASLDLLVITHMGYDVGLPGRVLCTPQMAANVVDQIGKFKFVLAHMGGWMDWKAAGEYLPGTGCYLDTSFSLGRIPIDATASLTPEMPDYMRGDCYQLLKQEEFLALVRLMGADHILFGSDAPWDDPLREIKWIQESGLKNEEIDLILEKNAKKLLE